MGRNVAKLTDKAEKLAELLKTAAKNKTKKLWEKLPKPRKGVFRAKLSINKIEKLLKNKTVDFNDVQGFVKEKGLKNQFKPKEPFMDGFRYEWTDGTYKYEMHGHGSNPKYAGKPNNAANPTMRVTRTNISTDIDEFYTTNKTWVDDFTNNANDIHIPLINSPYK